MKILFASALIPDPTNHVKGVFNYQRIKSHLNLGIDLCPVLLNSAANRDRVYFQKNYNLNDCGFNLDLSIKSINYIKAPVFHWPVNFFGQLSKYYLSKRCDLLHFSGISHYREYYLKTHFGIPYVLSLHGSDIAVIPHRSEKLKQLTLKTLNHAEHLFFVSNFLLEKARSLGYQKNNYSIVNRGVDPKLFFWNQEVRKEGNKVVGFVGNLKEVKGADYLPGIFHHVLKRTPDTKFILVGHGVLEESIKEKIQALGIGAQVSFIEKVAPKDLGDIMNALDVLVVPSRSEGFPNVGQEALACGTHVVGANVGGIPEALDSQGSLVDLGSNFESRFAEKVVQALGKNLDREKISAGVQDRTWDAQVAKEVAVYRGVLDGQDLDA